MSSLCTNCGVRSVAPPLPSSLRRRLLRRPVRELRLAPSFLKEEPTASVALCTCRGGSSTGGSKPAAQRRQQQGLEKMCAVEPDSVVRTRGQWAFGGVGR